MSNINKSIMQINALEELAHKDTSIHKLPPLVKLIITLVFIIMVVSFRPTEVSGLIPFTGLVMLCMIIGEIPWKPLAARSLIALPFVFFAGLSNLIISRDIIIHLGTFGITEGMISFTSLLLKTLLTVMAVLVLVSTTAMNDLIYAALSLKVPSIFIIQIMMTFRYISVLVREASLMYHAYLLRAPMEKGIRLKDFGSFLGQLILRSFDRAERIYQAMQCRGFEGNLTFSGKKKLGVKDWLVIVVSLVLMMAMRVFHISEMLGQMWIS